MKTILFLALLSLSAKNFSQSYQIQQSTGVLSEIPRINGNILPSKTDTFNIGEATTSWKDIYMTGSIYLSDKKFISINEKACTYAGILAGFSGNGFLNSAFGYKALHSNGSGSDNTAIGVQALLKNAKGSFNTACGVYAMEQNTYGGSNVAVGFNALTKNIAGSFNTAVGESALLYNVTGGWNTAIGISSLVANESGSYNTSVGDYTGGNNLGNTHCSFFGSWAGTPSNFTDYTNSTALGSLSSVSDNNQVRVGDASVTSIGGYQSWSTITDVSFQKNIKNDVPGLAFIKLLKPVTYTFDINGISSFLQEDSRMNDYVKKMNSENIKSLKQESRNAKSKIIYTGFVAQEVEEAAKKIGYDFSGIDIPKNKNSLYGLRYAEFVVPLVKAVQELSEENEALKLHLEKIEQMLSDKTSEKLLSSNNVSRGIRIFPNPAYSVLNINWNGSSSKTTIKVFDINNRLMITQQGVLNSAQLNVQKLAAGTYFLRLEDANGTVLYNEEFVKE